MFLLDTNALSELTKPWPDPGFLAWWQQHPEELHHVSVLTLGEIRKGILRLPTGTKSRRLTAWLKHVTAQFGDRVLDITVQVASEWAALEEQARKAGRTLGTVDTLIGATARAYSLALVTRNQGNFPFNDVLNPWTLEGDPTRRPASAGR